jgi:hypothetical protein
VLSQRKHIPVVKILLDSGALHGNYISDSFLHSYGDSLYELMEHSDELIVLADASKSCHVSKKLRLVVRVHAGIDGCEDVTFCSVYSVLPGLKHDIIVCLPSLVNEVMEIFIARIRSLKGSVSAHSLELDIVHNVMVLDKKGRGRPRRELKKESMQVPD